MTSFKDKLVEETDWASELDVNTMWKNMICVEMVTNKTLGECMGRAPSGKEPWWWNKEVKMTVKEKRKSYRELKKCRDKFMKGTK